MRPFLIFLLVTAVTGSIYSSTQTKSKTDSAATASNWYPEASVGINVSQISLSNWTQGGESSLTWTLIGTNGFRYLGEEWTFRNNVRAVYGRTKLGSQDFRTNDNEIFLETVLSKKISWEVDPYFSNTVRTSITRGYNYKVTPYQEIADFFDPGYVTQGLGFTYDKVAGFKTRLGFAVKETFTRNHRNYSDDTSTTYQEKFKIETGLESATNIDYEVLDDFFVKSALRLFTRYENLDTWDVRWDNAFIAKINEFINVNLTTLVIYEKKQSLKTQLKQSLQLGLTYKIF
jgi:hypothetical protein